MNTITQDRLAPAGLPNAPGVYQMLDESGAVLYVGKARNLRKRVSSYFRSSGLPPKTQAMMSRVADLQLTVTHTESEALLLENNLIKQHRPRYNIVLRDDKSYPFIRLADNHPFPRLSFYRGSRSEPGRYFGPFPNAGAVRQTLSQLQKIFPVRQCEDSFFRNRSRPCLQYQIKRCTAPCVGLVDSETYLEDVNQVALFLEGKSQRLSEVLMQKMEAAAAELDYEGAARYRDRIGALQRIQEHQYVAGQGGDADVVALCLEDAGACIDVVFIRDGRNLGSKSFFPEVTLEATPSTIVNAFLPQYYLGKAIPPEILINYNVADVAVLERAFAEQCGRRVKIKSRLRGHRARWLEMAVANSEEMLRRNLAGRASMNQRMESLQQELGLDDTLERIECFDISHTAGEATVASCVVFNSSGPVKSDYRRFNIKAVTPGDDYAAIAQALTRRYKRLKQGEGKIPDLLFIDGGKGQVSAAQEVMAELQVDGVQIVGVAKGRARKVGAERLILPGENRPRLLRSDSPALHLIQQIRDEAHRFAITGHRQRRGKSRVTSRLESIAGIGDRRRKQLLSHLGGLQEVARAGVEDLARVPGISPTLAQRIYSAFHSDR
ncbi:MAG: excinuclease ABC subunit UvrC [Gammaproteobacteria bacterium]|nr:excinuclease ABC subunit UvrC [Gammaproteobacteria bacterium]